MTAPAGLQSMPIGPIGQGTWQMEGDDRAGAVAALRRGIELGLTHIDTAEMYGSGEVERMVAEAIIGRRDEVFLASKVLPSNASHRGTLAACERSLERLETDRLDLYMLHWPGQHPLEETIGAFERLLADGKIIRYGVSNFDVPELEQALSIAGPGKLACNQVLYHPGERAIEHNVIPWCEKHEVPVVAYSPFGSAGGFPKPDSVGGRALAAVAARRRATPRQVALQFVVRVPSVVTIPKAACIEHVEDNAGARDLVLASEDIALLEDAFELGPPLSGLPFL